MSTIFACPECGKLFSHRKPCEDHCGVCAGDKPARLTVLQVEEEPVSKGTKRRTDTDRMKWLAGCGSDDGPIVEGFANILDEFWSFLGDAIRDRIGEENDSEDEEGTDADKLTAFRRMIDEAMDT